MPRAAGRYRARRRAVGARRVRRSGCDGSTAVGDLDTIFELEPTEKNRERQHGLERKRVALDEVKGRVSYYIQDLFFPCDEVLTAIYARERAFMEHTLESNTASC